MDNLERPGRDDALANGAPEPVGDGAGLSGAPDPEWASYRAWLEGELAAGRDPDEDRVPEGWELGDWEFSDLPQPATGVPPLAPAPPGPQPPSTPPSDSPPGAPPADTPPGVSSVVSAGGRPAPRFRQGDEADLLPPGPRLVALTEEAARRLSQLSDNELVGVLQAARRQEIREQYKQVLAVAEFGRRRMAAFEEARSRGVPDGRRPGEFPGEELAVELVTTRADAAHRIENAAALVTRLPATLAAMAAGAVDDVRASYIAFYTHGLTAQDAARADEILAAAAPDLRADQLARKAAALEMKLDPEAVKARKEHERTTGQRVEAGREASGNASLAAREMDTADAIASKAYIDAMAAALRNGGLDGTLGALRVAAMTDLTQGRNPLDRLKPRPAASPGDIRPAGQRHPGGTSGPGHGEPPADTAGSPVTGAAGPGYAGPDGRPGWSAADAENARYDDPLAEELEETARRRPLRRGDPAPLPALVNLLVPAGTLLGWSAAPAQADTWGLLDRDETRQVVSAAARHPRTRWCVTFLNDNGEAVAHACARGQHPGLLDGLTASHSPPPPPPPPATTPPAPSGTQPAAQAGPGPGPGPEAQAGPGPAAQEAGAAELLRRLGISPAAIRPVARGSCDHASAEDRYTPSRALRHLVRARTATCDAPACDAQARYADLDHTRPYPAGPTDQCNLGPKCRTHHRAKQAPGWHVEQPQPGVIRWTLPSGRVHLTTPTRYEI